MRSSTNFSVVSTLAMRWPVRSWKLQASKMRSTLSWMSCASAFSCSCLRLADRVLAASSMSSAAPRICWVARSALSDHRVELARDAAPAADPNALTCSAAISCLVRLSAIWMASVSDLRRRSSSALRGFDIARSVSDRGARADRAAPSARRRSRCGRPATDAIEHAGGHAGRRRRLLDAKDLALDRHRLRAPLRLANLDACA